MTDLHENELTSSQKSLESFAVRLKKAMGENYSVPFIASQLNMSVSGVRKWVNAQADPTRMNLITLSSILNVSFEWLATGEELSLQKKTSLNIEKLKFAIDSVEEVLSISNSNISTENKSKIISEVYEILLSKPDINPAEIVRKISSILSDMPKN